MAVNGSVLDLIGNTPLVDISSLSPNPEVKILVKLEGQNPGGSVKDRIALSLIEDAEARGVLTPGATLLEPSSGNTGIGLALVARLKGYHLKVVLPTNVSVERRQLLEIFGAEIIESPGGEGSNGAVRLVQRLAAEHPEWVFPYQYGNASNPKAHYEHTGPEIWRDCPEITHFVAGLGTSGTLLGVGRYLKEQNPAVQVWAVEPPTGEMVDGLRNLDDGYVPPIFSDWGGEELLNRKTVVGPRDSVEWTRRLLDLGIFAGFSTGAALAGAVRCASQIDECTIVIISPDGGWKYLSTGAWTGDLDEVASAPASSGTTLLLKPMMDDRPIGVFDSGFGGLTVARALIDLVPNERIVYVGDTARYPYGPRTAEEVAAFSAEIVEHLVEREGVKIVVVACNTAAAAALDELRFAFDVPIVGVIEPGLRAAAAITRNGPIGVIGTVGTIASGAYQRAAAELRISSEVHCLACPGFVEFVERGELESDQVHVLAERLLAPLGELGIDTLLLGCTHYPFLARTIGDVMGREVVLVSSAEETAFDVRRILSSDRTRSPHAVEGRCIVSSPRAISSGLPRWGAACSVPSSRAPKRCRLR